MSSRLSAESESNGRFAPACWCADCKRVAFAQRARVNAEENEFSDKRIAPQLERERAKISVVVRRRFHRLVRIGLHSFGRRMSRGLGK